MSWSMMTAVEESGLDRRLRPLAMKIASIVDDDGRGLWASIERLAWCLNCDERSVQRQLSELRQMGAIEATCHPGCVENPGRGHRPGETVHYRLVVEAMPQRAPWRERGDSLSPVGGRQFVTPRVTNDPERGDKLSPKEEIDHKKEDQRHTHTGARAREGNWIADADPSLNPEQHRLLRRLHQQTSDKICGGAGFPSPGWCDDLVRRGMTEGDVTYAIQRALELGYHNRSGTAYVRRVLEGRVKEREDGRDPDTARTGGGNDRGVRRGGGGGRAADRSGGRRGDGRGGDRPPREPIRKSDI